MALWDLIGTVKKGEANAASVSATFDASPGIIPGSLLIAEAHANAEHDGPPPGWSVVRNSSDPGSNGNWVAVYYKIATGDESLTVTVTATGASRSRLYIKQRDADGHTISYYDSRQNFQSSNVTSWTSTPMDAPAGALSEVFVGLHNNAGTWGTFDNSYTTEGTHTGGGANPASATGSKVLVSGGTETTTITWTTARAYNGVHALFVAEGGTPTAQAEVDFNLEVSADAEEPTVTHGIEVTRTSPTEASVSFVENPAAERYVVEQRTPPSGTPTVYDPADNPQVVEVSDGDEVRVGAVFYTAPEDPDSVSVIESVTPTWSNPHGSALCGDKIVVSTRQSPARIAIFDVDDLSSPTILAQVGFSNADAVTWSEYKQRAYALGSSDSAVPIAEINPAAGTWTPNAIVDTTNASSWTSGGPSLVAVGKWLYVLVYGGVSVVPKIIKYDLDTYAKADEKELTGLNNGHAITYDPVSGYLYAASGTGALWVVRIDPDTLDYDELVLGFDPNVVTDDITVDHNGILWCALEGSGDGGAVLLVDTNSWPDYEFFDFVPRGSIGGSWFSAYADGYIWISGNASPNGMLYRIDPDTRDVKVFPVPGIPYINEFLDLGPNGYFLTTFAGSNSVALRINPPIPVVGGETTIWSPWTEVPPFGTIEQATASLNFDLGITAEAVTPAASVQQADAQVDFSLGITADAITPTAPVEEAQAQVGFDFEVTATAETPTPGTDNATATVAFDLEISAEAQTPTASVEQAEASLDLSLSVTATAEAPQPGVPSATASVAFDLGISAEASTPTASIPQAEAAIALSLSVTASATSPRTDLADYTVFVGPPTERPPVLVQGIVDRVLVSEPTDRVVMGEPELRSPALATVVEIRDAVRTESLTDRWKIGEPEDRWAISEPIIDRGA